MSLRRPVGRVLRGVAVTLRPDDRTAAALTTSAMAASFSNGIFYSVSIVFLTQIAGLSTGTIGLGLTLAGAVGLLASFAAGYLADLVGARRVLIASTVAQGLALFAYTATTTTTTFITAASAVVAARSAQNTARATVLAQAFTPAQAVLVRARLGVVINVFIGLGTTAAALAFVAGDAPAYRTALLAAGAFVLASALPLRAVAADRLAAAMSPSDNRTDQTPDRRSPLRDSTFLMVSALNIALAMHAGMLTIGVPLWITTRTTAPPVTVSALLLLNALLVVTIQVRVARKVRGVRDGARTVALAGALLALACALYALTAGRDVTLVVVLLLLLAAMVTHTMGEIAAEVGSWTLAFDLSPQHAHGRYQGISQASVAAGAMIAPFIVTGTAIQHGPPGWLLLGLFFAGAGMATPVIVRPRTTRSAI